MPHKIPLQLKAWLETNIPATHKIWWMRARITDAQPKQVNDDGLVSLYFRLSVRDIDAEKSDKKGYMIDIFTNGEFSDFRVDDRVSLFGHEPVDATFLSLPRYFYHHENRCFGPCFETRFIDEGKNPTGQLVAKQKGLFGSIKNALGHNNLEGYYRELGRGIDTHIAKMDDQKFACVNPRPENVGSGGGRLVD